MPGLNPSGIGVTALCDSTTGSLVHFYYDGVVDAGEMRSLAQAGITSISLNRTDVTGTNQGHGRGFESAVSFADGSTATAGTVYFQTDRQNTVVDNTPTFTPAIGVDKLPQLPGSGQINSIAWKASTDASFMAACTALTDNAGSLTPSQLKAQFEFTVTRVYGDSAFN